MNIKRIYLRYIDGGGLPATISMSARDKDPLPKEALDEQLKSAAAQEGVRSFKGVYFTVATVDARRLPQIASDSRVYLADVTTNVVLNQLVAASVAGAESATIVVNMPPSPFWDMEQLGLDSFQR